MITLAQPTKPYEIRLFDEFDVYLTVKPMTTPSKLAAQVRAKRRVREEHGLVEDADSREALVQAYVIYELAEAHIIDWRGVVDDDGNKAPLTRERIIAFMDLYPVGEVFSTKLSIHQGLMTLAKKDSGASANGISKKAEAPDTVKPANSSS